MYKFSGLKFGHILITLFLIVFTSYTYTYLSAENKPRYATWNGLGFDKWASIWLLDRHVVKGTVRLLPEFGELRGFTLFDVPGAEYHRDAEASTFSKILSGEVKVDSSLASLSMIVHDVEINLWEPDKSNKSTVVEFAFRELQRSHGRNYVSYECYMAFFDTIYKEVNGMDVLIPGGDSSILNGFSCATLVKVASNKDVAEVSISNVVKALALGKKVIFLDVRESEEFSEVHIPGAINLKIRELREAPLQKLLEADLVVSYCVKDFRGYEMAKLLLEAGVKNSVLLNPYGLKGWIKKGLPVYRKGMVNEGEAQNMLAICVAGVTCLKN